MPAASTLAIDAVNALDRDEFVARFGAIYEDTPSVAAAAWAARPFASLDALARAMAAVVDGFAAGEQLAILRAHPELGAGRPMAALSVDEQRGAGLDRIAAAVADELTTRNRAYRERFGFPFIVAVRGRGPAEILDELRVRVGHDAATELATAIAQVHQIARFRLADLVTDAGGAAPAAGATETGPQGAGLRVDGARLCARLAQLAEIGATPEGGVTRLAYSPGDVAARDLVAGWMREAGLEVELDAAANLVGRRAGHDLGSDLALGSHLDTVVNGGTLDGAYGVLAAVEVADALQRAGHSLRHGLRVVAFANEEGANGTPGMVGSHAVAGHVTPTDLATRDDDGVTLADLVRRAGGDPDAIATATWAAGTVAAYLELHIEQGPVLAATDVPIGVVEAITGRRMLEISIRGVANHAGTTPMPLRHDAVAAGAELVLAVERLASDEGVVRVATVGHVVVAPNVRNVIAGHVHLGVDLRDVDDERIDRAVALVRAEAAAIGARRGVIVEVVDGPRTAGMPSDAGLLADVERAAGALGYASVRLPSGAGHDAQVVAHRAPIAMIFVPSLDGVSHSPAERTPADALARGADVLLHAVVHADARLERAQ